MRTLSSLSLVLVAVCSSGSCAYTHGCSTHPELPKPVGVQSEIGNLRRLQLKLQFVSDEGNEFGIGGFSFGIADGVTEKSLQRIQVSSVPGHFDGMADGPLHSGRRGLECFRHLRVQYLGDGIGVLTARLGALPDAAG